MYAIGITSYIKDAELDEIAGSPDRRFHIADFKNLDSHLIGQVQNLTCGDRVPISE
jgi:hypothetical protein